MSALKTITELEIDVTRWYAAGNVDNPDVPTYLEDYWPRLLNKGSMCCLGFACESAGVPSEALDEKPDPDDLSVIVPLFSEEAEYSRDLMNTSLSMAAMRINDDEEMTIEEKKRALIALFARHGVALTFKEKGAE